MKKRPTASLVFWDIVEMARQNYQDWKGVISKLKDEYLKMFLLDFDYLASELDTDEFQDAVAKIRGQHSEDDSRDVAEWAVLQGKKFFDEIFADPNKLPSKADYDADYTAAFADAQVQHEERFGELQPALEEDEMYRFRYGD